MADRPAGLSRSWGTAVACVVLGVVTAGVVGVLPVQLVRAGSGSMAPTVPAHALLVVDHRDSPVGRRDVVTVSAAVTGVEMVKRVVAVAGETVAVEDGRLVVDGRAVCERDVDPGHEDGVWFGPVTVPAGSVFLLGDDRASSVDSREFGAVPRTEVTGRVLLRAWPDPGVVDDGLC